jgi:hypothetical protein
MRVKNHDNKTQIYMMPYPERRNLNSYYKNITISKLYKRIKASPVYHNA